MESLCNRCSYRQLVTAELAGTVLDRCSVLKVGLSDLGRVEQCSDFEAKDLPYLFAREAWKLTKDDDGVLRFKAPDEN